MGNLILDNISLILLLPLWIFLIIMCGRFFSVYVNKNVIYFLTLLSSFAGVGICGYALMNISEPIEFVYPFIKINEFTISFGLQADKLSLIVALLLFVISFAIQVFSVSYMNKDQKSYKFFALLNLFNFSMAFLIFSPNLFQFYVFWELVGIISYLLIGFDYKNSIKSEASRRVFLMNRIGDTALIAGIVLVSYYMYSYTGNVGFITLSFDDFNVISTLLMAYTTTPVFYAICGLFILSAIVKSAQFPFYTWLQDAMEANAPVSALLHSATMVAAGVYLVIKMMPFFTLSPVLTNSILIVGIATAIICSILASIEKNYKKILAYSTSANLGLMFFALGLVNIKAAIVLLAVHAFIKSALFILLPTENEMPKINFVLFLIAASSLAGILLSGYVSKEIVYKSIEYSQSLSLLFLLICFVSAFYITRLAALVYKDTNLKNNTDLTELTAFLILLFGNISLYVVFAGSYSLAEPLAVAVGGLALAILFAKHDALDNIKNCPKLLERTYNVFVPRVYAGFTQGLNYIENNFLSNYKPIIFIAKWLVKVTNFVEIGVMNKSVSFVSNLSKSFSKLDMMLQTKNIQAYNAYAFIILTIILALVIAGYTIIFR